MKSFAGYPSEHIICIRATTMPLSKSCPKKKKDCHQFGNLNAGQKARAGRMPKTRSEKTTEKTKDGKNVWH